MSNLKEANDLLIKRGKARGKPVGISLFRDEIPKGYEPIQDVPCSIVKYARDEGRKVYFDADHHDCLVGLHHSGILPGKKEIVSGEYLSAQFTVPAEREQDLCRWVLWIQCFLSPQHQAK